MIAGKWNYDKREYDLYVTPEEWHTPLYCEDMDEIINCAACGRELPYGDCYTSKEIHSGGGLGYPVCEECYVEEWVRVK